MKTLTYTIQKLKKVIGYVKVPVVVIALLVAGIYVLTKVTPLTVAIGYGTTTKTAPATFSPAAGSEVQTGSEKIAYGFVPSAMASLPSDERIAALNKMKQAGFSQVRVNFNWNFMEPVQGRYVWSGTDSFMKQISDAGLRPIIQIDHTPAWNRPAICKTDAFCAPLKTDEYGVFAAAAAQRYKKYNIVAYEIWNEQNSINFWKPFPNPNQYGHLLESGYEAIKKVDPNATVLVGGLSGDSVDRWGSNFIDPRTYLSQLYATNDQKLFDGVAYHPYIKTIGLPDSVDEFNGWAKMADTTPSIRSIMVANNDSNKGVWITVFGIPTGGKGQQISDLGAIPKGSDHTTFEVQAEITQAAIDDMSQYNWIKNFMWYSYQDNADYAKNTESAYGLFQYGGQQKPVYDVIRKANSQL